MKPGVSERANLLVGGYEDWIAGLSGGYRKIRDLIEDPGDRQQTSKLFSRELPDLKSLGPKWLTSWEWWFSIIGLGVALTLARLWSGG